MHIDKTRCAERMMHSFHARCNLLIHLLLDIDRAQHCVRLRIGLHQLSGADIVTVHGLIQDDHIGETLAHDLDGRVGGQVEVEEARVRGWEEIICHIKLRNKVLNI